MQCQNINILEKCEKNTGVRLSVYISGQEQEALYVPQQNKNVNICMHNGPV
jgi:hypothetical protein